MANRVWTDEEVTYLKENAHRLKDAVLAKRLEVISGRPVTLHCLRKKRARLGIKKVGGRGVVRIKKR